MIRTCQGPEFRPTPDRGRAGRRSVEMTGYAQQAQLPSRRDTVKPQPRWAFRPIFSLESLSAPLARCRLERAPTVDGLYPGTGGHLWARPGVPVVPPNRSTAVPGWGRSRPLTALEVTAERVPAERCRRGAQPRPGIPDEARMDAGGRLVQSVRTGVTFQDTRVEHGAACWGASWAMDGPPRIGRSWCPWGAAFRRSTREGLSMSTPASRRPGWRSSVTSRVAPARRAASTMRASQNDRVWRSSSCEAARMRGTSI